MVVSTVVSREVQPNGYRLYGKANGINPSHISMRRNDTLLSSGGHPFNYSVDHKNFITTYGSIAEPSLVINGINELSSGHQSTHVVVKLDSLQQVELPAELGEIAQAIEESKYILELIDNFDEEDAKACEFATWERAIRFLVEYSKWVFKSFHYVIDRPQIYDGPHGSIDMLWRTDRYRWLINFPEDRTQPASFYGDDFKLDQIKGTFNPSIDSRRVFMFLLGANQTMWPIEEIPNQDTLYYRIHQSYLIRSELKPGAFREIGDGMSTDWSKYSTPLDSRNRAKKPEQNGIISLKVGSLRQLKLTVVHAPSKDNRSHSLVKGVDDVEMRLKLLDKLRDTADDHIQWEIHPMATN